MQIFLPIGALVSTKPYYFEVLYPWLSYSWAIWVARLGCLILIIGPFVSAFVVLAIPSKVKNIKSAGLGLLVWLQISTLSLLMVYVAVAKVFFGSHIALGATVFPGRLISYKQIPEIWFALGKLRFLVDSLALPFLFLNFIIISLSIFYLMHTTVNFAEFRKFSILLLFILGLLNIIFLTTNLLIFYAAFELLALPLFILIGAGPRYRRLRAATMFFMYTVVFSYFIFMSIAYLWVWFGTLEYDRVVYLIEVWGLQREFSGIFLFLLLSVAFLAKVPVVPLHIWLPEAHVEAPTVGSVVLASLVLKVGAYGLVRFVLPLVSKIDMLWVLTFLCGLGLLSTIFSTYMAVGQVDFKRVIAYSSVAHLSFGAVGLFTLTAAGKAGAVYYNFGHGLVSAGLFFLVGMLYSRYGTRLIKYYSGLGLMPKLSSFFIFFSFANLSFPGTINFVGEFLVLSGLIAINHFYFALIVLFIFVGAALFSIWVYLRMSTGMIGVHYLGESHEDLLPFEVTILSVLALLILGLGLCPEVFFRLIYQF